MINQPKPKRPMFPDGYGFDVNTPHEPQTWPTVVERIRNSRNYWICTASRSAKPHAMPVWGVWVAGELYFVTKRTSRKAKNLYANAQIVVHLESGDDVVVMEGEAIELKGSEKYAEVAMAYSEKYEGDQIFPKIEVVFQLECKQVFTWLERAFHTSATKWVYDDR